MKYWPTKTVAEIKDMGLDWAPTLSKLDDATIVSSSWQRLRGSIGYSVPGDLEETGRRTVTRVSGGTAGQESILRNTVTLSTGQVLTEDVFIKVRA